MFISLNNPTDVKTMNGIVITHNKLIIAVSDIESATSPLAKEVNRLDVTPPGAAAIIMTPIANSGAIGHIFTRINAITGSKITCEKAPKKKSRGRFKTLKKSLPVNPSPNTSIMKASAKGKIISVTIFISDYYKDSMNKRILLFLIIILQISSFHYIFAVAETPKNYLKGKFYSSVKNHFLIASEKMKDNRFEKTVIIMLENDEGGALGLVINRPIGSIPLALLIDPSLSTSEEREELYKVDIPIFWGGPVEVKKIFILHSIEYKTTTTKNYGNISISQDYNILFDIAKNKGPKKSLVILGYSGWGSGQLEGEMERGHWILSDLNSNIIFEKESKKKWKEAYKNSFIKI